MNPARDSAKPRNRDKGVSDTLRHLRRTVPVSSRRTQLAPQITVPHPPLNVVLVLSDRAAALGWLPAGSAEERPAPSAYACRTAFDHHDAQIPDGGVFELAIARHTFSEPSGCRRRTMTNLALNDIGLPPALGVNVSVAFPRAMTTSPNV